MTSSSSDATIADRLASWLLPSPCLACRVPLPASRSLFGLCAACRDRAPALDPASACPCCSEPLPAPAPGICCPACERARPAFDRLLAVWRYAPPVDAVIQAYKFRRLDYLGAHLAGAIARACGPLLADSVEEPTLVSYVPLHWRRYLSRGYDQAREIASPLARELALPLRSTLRRRLATPAQSSLDREERRRNLRDVFRAARSSRVAGCRVLLVDDVATTGATLDAAARTLKAAGARSVVALVAARTPLLHPGPPRSG